MSFETAFLDGYKKHTKHFDGWCRKASTILGDVTQCGILEVDSSGHGTIMANRPDFAEEYLAKEAYLLDTHLTYDPNIDNSYIKPFHTRDEYMALHAGKDSMFENKFDLHFGFSYLVKVSDDVNRIYWFASSNQSIYDRMLRKQTFVKKLIQCFAEESEKIIEFFQDKKFNILEVKEDYFVESKEKKICPREELNNFLHTMEILPAKHVVSKKEFQCLQLYLRGKTLKQISEAQGLKINSVGDHLRSLQLKLNVNSNHEMISKLGNLQY